MMKSLKYLLILIRTIGLTGICGIILYVEWVYLQQYQSTLLSFKAQIQIIVELFSSGIFWILLSMVIGGHYYELAEKNRGKNIANCSIESNLGSISNTGSLKNKRKRITGSSSQLYANNHELQREEILVGQDKSSRINLVDQGKQKRIESEINSHPNHKQEQSLETRSVIDTINWAIQSEQKLEIISDEFGNRSYYTVIPISLSHLSNSICLDAINSTRERYFARERLTFDLRYICQVRIHTSNASTHQTGNSSYQDSNKVLIEVDQASLSENNQQNTSNDLLDELPIDNQHQPNQVSNHQCTSQSFQRSSNSYQTSITSSNIRRIYRPYINHRIHQLEHIFTENWSNLDILRKIHDELGFRNRRRAIILRTRTSQRLEQLTAQETQDSRFNWPAVNGNENNNSQPLPNNAFRNERGLLSHYGYRVGNSGLPQDERRRILDEIFSSSVLDVDNGATWGEPRTARRLQRLANTIAMLARNARRRRNSASFAQAIADWESDLDYLRENYYTRCSAFRWPQ